jgi:hypothetical protein
MKREGSGNWSVKALGHIGMGRATHGGYDPIFEDIKKSKL